MVLAPDDKEHMVLAPNDCKFIYGSLGSDWQHVQMNKIVIARY